MCQCQRVAKLAKNWIPLSFIAQMACTRNQLFEFHWVCMSPVSFVRNCFSQCQSQIRTCSKSQREHIGFGIEMLGHTSHCFWYQQQSCSSIKMHNALSPIAEFFSIHLLDVVTIYIIRLWSKTDALYHQLSYVPLFDQLSTHTRNQILRFAVEIYPRRANLHHSLLRKRPKTNQNDSAAKRRQMICKAGGSKVVSSSYHFQGITCIFLTQPSKQV